MKDFLAPKEFHVTIQSLIVIFKMGFIYLYAYFQP